MPAASSHDASTVATKGWSALGPRKQALIAGGLLLLVILNLLLLIWWFGGEPTPDRGPAPPLAKVRAAPPEVPSLPGLDLNVPKPLPGLETVDPAFAPSVTPDTTVLVFAGRGAATGDYDLYQTSRSSVTEPFAVPVKIKSCSSALYETFPSLSPDGLELLFLRFADEPTLLYATRSSVDEEFGTPVTWPVMGELADGRKVGGAQFIDPQHVQFVTRGKTPNEDRRFMMTSRSEPGSPFGSPAPLEFSNAPIPQFVNATRERTYFGTPGGLFVAARESESEAFALPARIFDLVVDGPVWVAPKEDVIFFCSPGPGGKVEASRRLWMMRF